jgi:hypothetical protein
MYAYGTFTLATKRVPPRRGEEICPSLELRPSHARRTHIDIIDILDGYRITIAGHVLHGDRIVSPDNAGRVRIDGKSVSVVSLHAEYWPELHEGRKPRHRDDAPTVSLVPDELADIDRMMRQMPAGTAWGNPAC